MHWRFFIFLFALFFSLPATAKQLTLLIDGNLSNWTYQTFRNIKPTEYHVEYDTTLKASVLMAVSQQSASGYIYKKKIDLKQTPWLHFQWFIDEAAGTFDEQKKEGDDFPFRIYFVKSSGFRYKSLALVHSQQGGKQTWKSPYDSWLNRLYIHAVNQNSSLQQWKTTTLNLTHLWQNLFDGDDAQIQLVGLMSDSDSAKGIMRVRYGGIVLSDSEKSPFTEY